MSAIVIWAIIVAIAVLAQLALNAAFMVLMTAAIMWVVEKIREWWIRRP
jgi:hypothetical protein